MRKSFVAILMCGVMLAQPLSAGAAVLSAKSLTVPAPTIGAVLPAVETGRSSSGTGNAEVVEVRHRRHPVHRHSHRRRGSGWGAFGTGVAVGIIGVLIARGISESAAQERMARCARDFDTFDPETGTYITRSGHERLCPYLR